MIFVLRHLLFAASFVAAVTAIADERIDRAIVHIQIQSTIEFDDQHGCSRLDHGAR